MKDLTLTTVAAARGNPGQREFRCSFFQTEISGNLTKNITKLFLHREFTPQHRENFGFQKFK